MKHYFVLVGAFLLVFVISGCVNSENSDITFSESRQIADQMIVGSPMYKFDGFDLILVNSEKLSSFKFQFDYQFKSKNSGYGDRASKIISPVITLHNATLIVENGSVIYAVVDNKWDILGQKFLE